MGLVGGDPAEEVPVAALKPGPCQLWRGGGSRKTQSRLRRSWGRGLVATACRWPFHNGRAEN